MISASAPARSGFSTKRATRAAPGASAIGSPRRDVAVIGGRPVGLDAERHRVAGARPGGRALHGVHEGGRVGHDVVGGHDQHHGLRVAGGGVQGCDRHGGGGVAALRLEQDVGGETELVALLGDDEAGLGRGDDGRRREDGGVRHARQRRLEGRALGVDQPGELLGHALPRRRPQPRPRPSAQDHRVDLDRRSGHGDVSREGSAGLAWPSPPRAGAMDSSGADFRICPYRRAGTGTTCANYPRVDGLAPCSGMVISGLT